MRANKKKKNMIKVWISIITFIQVSLITYTQYLLHT